MINEVIILIIGYIFKLFYKYLFIFTLTAEESYGNIELKGVVKDYGNTELGKALKGCGNAELKKL